MKYAVALVFAAIFVSRSALASSPLKLSYPAKSKLKNPVSVAFSLEGNSLKAHFEVLTAKISAKPVLGPGEYPYQHDVVELFISVGGEAGNPFPYYEFELSPYDQTFEVRIVSLKQPFQDGLKLGIEHSVVRTKGGWSGDLIIPLNTLGWDGDPKHIIGNAYSILGEKPNRSYWSLSLPQQKKPNFHKPNFFKPLL